MENNSGTNFPVGESAAGASATGGEGWWEATAGSDAGGASDSIGTGAVTDPDPPPSALPAPTRSFADGHNPEDPCGETPCAVSLDELPMGAWLSCGESLYVNDASQSLWRLELNSALVSDTAPLINSPVACVELTGAEGVPLTLFWIVSDEGDWSIEIVSWDAQRSTRASKAVQSTLSELYVRLLPLGPNPKETRPPISELAREWRALPPVRLQEPPASSSPAHPYAYDVASVAFVGGVEPGQPRGSYELSVQIERGADLSAEPSVIPTLRALDVSVADRDEMHISANESWISAVSRTGDRLSLESVNESSRTQTYLPSAEFQRAHLSMQWVAWQTAQGVFLRALSGPQNSSGLSDTLIVDTSTLTAPVIEALSDDLLLLSEPPRTEGLPARWFAYDLRARRLLPLDVLLGVESTNVWLQGRWLIWSAPVMEPMIATRQLNVWRLPIAAR